MGPTICSSTSRTPKTFLDPLGRLMEPIRGSFFAHFISFNRNLFIIFLHRSYPPMTLSFCAYTCLGVVGAPPLAQPPLLRHAVRHLQLQPGPLVRYLQHTNSIILQVNKRFTIVCTLACSQVNETELLIDCINIKNYCKIT